MSARRRFNYALIGFVLGIGAPLGALLLHYLSHGGQVDMVQSELLRDPLLYVYLWLSTSVVLALFGFILGRTYDALQHTARRDTLTGLYNRMSLNDFLRQEVAEAQRYQAPLSVIILDLDRFKELNDAHGHLAGDRVLREVAHLLRREQREADLLCRWGGEEFLVVLPRTGPEEAAQVAERMREAVGSLSIPWEKQALHVTVSAGVTGGTWARTADELLRVADAALYRSKELGRNRVTLSAP